MPLGASTPADAKRPQPPQCGHPEHNRALAVQTDLVSSITANLIVSQFSIILEENIFLLILSFVVPANSSESLPFPE